MNNGFQPSWSFDGDGRLVGHTAPGSAPPKRTRRAAAHLRRLDPGNPQGHWPGTDYLLRADSHYLHTRSAGSGDHWACAISLAWRAFSSSGAYPALEASTAARLPSRNGNARRYDGQDLCYAAGSLVKSPTAGGRAHRGQFAAAFYTRYMRGQNLDGGRGREHLYEKGLFRPWQREPISPRAWKTHLRRGFRNLLATNALANQMRLMLCMGCAYWICGPSGQPAKAPPVATCPVPILAPSSCQTCCNHRREERPGFVMTLPASLSTPATD